jgi:hypothetical protein
VRESNSFTDQVNEFFCFSQSRNKILRVAIVLYCFSKLIEPSCKTPELGRMAVRHLDMKDPL